MPPHGQRRRTPLLVLLFILILLHISIVRTAEVGYGPLFDPCGDNCQTQMVDFCTVGHDTAQMRICWCDDEGYLERMGACLDSCDPAVSNKTVQRDQMLRYRNIVCVPTAIAKDMEFQEYYKTRFANVAGGSFTPEVTRGIPPPTASPAGITRGVTLTPESSSGVSSDSTSPLPEFITRTKPTGITTLTVSTTPTASSFVTALPSTTAGLTLKIKGLSTIQLVGVILGTAVISVLLSLSMIFCIRRRNPQRPFWNPPPPPPLPRPHVASFLPYYAPTSPPPTIYPQRMHNIEPHAISTSTSSAHSTRDGDSSMTSPSRGRGGYSYSLLESPALPTPPQSHFYTKSTPVGTRILTPIIEPIQPMIQVSSSSAIAAAAAAERNSRGSTHTLIEPEPQQGIVIDKSRRRSWSQGGPGNGGRKGNFDENDYCAEDDCTASCSSWSERSWCEEDDDVWWDLRESQMMGP